MVGSEETEVADFDKAFRENVLQETLEELLDRERTTFERAGIGSAVLESDLRILHAAVVHEGEQAAIADGHAVDVRGKILESGLPIAHGQAMDNPILRPHFGGDDREEGRVAQKALKTGAEEFGERPHGQEEIGGGADPAPLL